MLPEPAISRDPAGPAYAHVLRDEATRCERISSGLTDRLIADLLAWADEYRRQAASLDAVLGEIAGEAGQRAA